MGVILWLFSDLEAGTASLLYRLTRQYNSVHGWGILKLTYLTADDMELLLWLPLSFLGAWIALFTTWGICNRKTVLPGTLPGLLCLLACLIVTTTVPDGIWLYLFLFSLLLICLTHTLRREQEAGANKLTAIAAIPLAVMLLLLFILSPASTYEGEATARDTLNGILDSEVVQQVFGELTPVGNSGSSVSGSTVRLDAVGIRVRSNAEVLQVHTEYSGTLYLRGRALDSYDGISWTDSGQGTPSLYWPEADALTHLGEVTVQTRFAHMMLYVPYYVRSMDLADVTKVLANDKKLTKYSFSAGRIPNETELKALTGEDQDFDRYIHLTESVKKWAEPLALEITAGKQSVYEKAQAIADYVRSSAKYSLNTDKMPGREREFVKWFLEDSSTGYCVHFASSATVLLQAAGIPARYVTGYMTPVGKDCYTAVQEQDAHAWAEYWLPGFGWMILEATPAAEAEPEVEETIPAPAQPEKKPLDGELLKKLGILLLVCLPAIAFLQRGIRRYMRRKKLVTGTERQQLLAHWQEAMLLSGRLGVEPDSHLRELAERAKFSPHPIREQDIDAFKEYLSQTKKQLKKQNLFRRLYNYFILAI